MAATLLRREACRTVRLSNQSYGEGAYYGDFNRDGQINQMFDLDGILGLPEDRRDAADHRRRGGRGTDTSA